MKSNLLNFTIKENKMLTYLINKYGGSIYLFFKINFSVMEDHESQRKLRILCLHGFRTSSEILKQLVLRWPEPVLQKLNFVFLDGQFLAQGRSDVEGIFDPPYYEWFQANEVVL